MSTRKNHRDTYTTREALTDSPFAALSKARPATPDDAHKPETPTAPAEATDAQAGAASPDSPPYKVRKTRKGALPVRVEKRSRGKLVTIVEGVEGDASALLACLKKSCGAGGVLRDNHVEIQGDHRAYVIALLAEPADR
ncbi:MAG: translation initiation factor [Candidatus Hydrogenedentota bacterium]